MTRDQRLEVLQVLNEPLEEGEFFHVYPLKPVADMQHSEHPRVVDAPLEDCWLCQEGICVQSDEDDGIVLHATWGGH